MNTLDGKEVKVHDNVWVIGSDKIHKTHVMQPMTAYAMFDLIPVSQSFSTKKAAEKYKAEMIKSMRKL